MEVLIVFIVPYHYFLWGIVNLDFKLRVCNDSRPHSKVNQNPGISCSREKNGRIHASVYMPHRITTNIEGMDDGTNEMGVDDLFLLYRG